MGNTKSSSPKQSKKEAKTWASRIRSFFWTDEEVLEEKDGHSEESKVDGKSNLEPIFKDLVT